MSAQTVPRILVVDNEAPVLFSLEELLWHFGYSVTTAANGTEALALILRDSFDLLLVDRDLAGISGFEIARRAQVHQPSAAILMLTRGVNARTAAGDKQAGPFQCIRKTACPREMLDRVAALTQQEYAGGWLPG